MSAIDTYTKYNLHSAAPYIGWECLGMQKTGGKRPGKGNVQGERPGWSVRGKMFYTQFFIGGQQYFKIRQLATL